MSDPKPHPRGASHGNGARYLALLLLGLVVGAICTVMAMRALEARQDQFPGSIMHVQQWHFGQLRNAVEQNRCSASDSLPHLEALRVMANDLEPAFPDLRDDKRFIDSSSQLRGVLDVALATRPADCTALGETTAAIGQACKACHQDFRG
jgi:hypothetical protein